jgi:glycosyltransferase involved in cell wall biosynthesis
LDFPFEVILVDDKSTDNTREIILKLAKKYPDLKHFYHDSNEGGGATRNTAVEHASGRLIFCLDSDDLIAPDTLKKLVDYQKEKRCDGVGISTSIKFKGRDVNDVVFVNNFNRVGEKISLTDLLERNGLCSLYSTFLITKEAFNKIGGYPTKHGFDTQGLAWRFLSAGLTAYTAPDTTYLHRVQFHKSYYLRESNAGKVNYNWRDIFIEHFNLFGSAAQEFILNFDCKDFIKNIFEELKGRDDVFRDNVSDFLGNSEPKEKITLPPRIYIERNSPQGILLRIKDRLKKINAIKHLLWIIKTRWENDPSLFIHWIFLRFRKFFKTDFYEYCEEATVSIDVVIPTVSKDYGLLREVVESVRKNLCHPINNIYIVSKNEPHIADFCLKNDCRFVDELSVLGYGKENISYTAKGVDRSGWMLQQLLKLSADTFIKSENYLVLDSDTMLISKHSFIKDGKFVFLQSEEWHEPYFKAFKKMFGYKAPTKLSYTSHMMIFNTQKLKKMKKELEKKHGQSWDQVYLSTIDESEASCVSDYDTYANWMLYNYPEMIINHPLYNKAFPRGKFRSLEVLEGLYSHLFKSLSFHSYIK